MSFVLYLITDPQLGDPVLATRAALSAGPPGRTAVQVRHPGASPRELHALASALRPICRRAGAPLLVNDRVDVAQLAGADGVHLPERGLDVAQARALLGPKAWIARSCHDREGLVRAEAAGASFATLGPVGPVPGKNPPLGIDGFADAIRGLSLPVYALGGVNAGSARPLADAGAAGVAVVRSVFAAPDPAAAVTDLLRALT